MKSFKDNIDVKLVFKKDRLDVISDSEDGLTYLLKKYHNRRGISIKVFNCCSLNEFKYSIIAPDAILYEIIRKWSEMGNVRMEVVGDGVLVR